MAELERGAEPLWESCSDAEPNSPCTGEVSSLPESPTAGGASLGYVEAPTPLSRLLLTPMAPITAGGPFGGFPSEAWLTAMGLELDWVSTLSAKPGKVVSSGPGWGRAPGSDHEPGGLPPPLWIPSPQPPPEPPP